MMTAGWRRQLGIDRPTDYSVPTLSVGVESSGILFGLHGRARDVMRLRHCSDSCCSRSAVGRGLSGVGEITGFPTSWCRDHGQPDYLGSLGRGNVSVIAPAWMALHRVLRIYTRTNGQMPVVTAKISDEPAWLSSAWDSWWDGMMLYYFICSCVHVKCYVRHNVVRSIGIPQSCGLRYFGRSCIWTNSIFWI